MILAIESSCDETAVAVVDERGRVLAHELASQIETHVRFGGVVPEVASRGHFAVIDDLARRALKNSGVKSAQLGAVAATCGPGLIGPLLVGASYGEGMARGLGVPFRGVHHLRGHLASTLLEPSIEEAALTLKERAAKSFPALVLLASGGHTQVLEVVPNLHATKLADTADDAAGECFDKSAKLMGLGYPGGPAIEALASELKPDARKRAAAIRDALPKPRSEEGFSFSGLKTAVRLRLEREPDLKASPEFCWALQETIGETLVRGLDAALAKAPHRRQLSRFVLCGGVSATRRLREGLTQWARGRGLEPKFPPLKYSTDNAAMIAAAAWIQDPKLELKEVIARTPLELGDA